MLGIDTHRQTPNHGGTPLSITSRRRAKLIGGALFAASLAASSFATVTNVSADLGDSAAGAAQGYIRVKPGATTWEDQEAPVVMAGATGADAAPVQLMIPADWEAGDIITLQVQADATVGAPDEHSTNCLSPAQSIGFTTPYRRGQRDGRRSVRPIGRQPVGEHRPRCLWPGDG